MPKLLRNVLAVVGGVVVGSAVNMAIVTVGPSLVPPPAGVDVTTAEGFAAGIHLFEPKHFLAPFLAHALGTFAGALVAYLVAIGRKAVPAWVVGGFFLLGGIAAAYMIPAPAWFIALDLLAAYLPIAWLAIRVGRVMLR
ncbi:signal peptide protein [Lysobacter arseniciresistens ZS79]|uniref:Signal peptide protein n=1 Tax=Lysobacter arseniciresistens ZS79 TaxID=913325 RepID=A0A0A0F8R8_9GAMM|nr:hypothetical protein [Lysobacter arseniciresistens]KGM57787.1 signal peptide protein [Lysobacter arseniciresistens ZS79]